MSDLAREAEVGCQKLSQYLGGGVRPGTISRGYFSLRNTPGREAGAVIASIRGPKSQISWKIKIARIGHGSAIEGLPVPVGR
jgi:hypothetical protein